MSATALQLTVWHDSSPTDKIFLSVADFTDFADMSIIITNTSIFTVSI